MESLLYHPVKGELYARRVTHLDAYELFFYDSRSKVVISSCGQFYNPYMFFGSEGDELFSSLFIRVLRVCKAPNLGELLDKMEDITNRINDTSIAAYQSYVSSTSGTDVV